MIVSFKRFLHGRFAKVLWGLIALGFVTPFLIQRFGPGPRVAFEVDGKKIYLFEFNEKVKSERERFSGFKKEEREYYKIILESMGESTDPQVMAYVNLIRESLLSDFSSKLSISPTTDFVLKYVSEKFPHYFTEGRTLDSLRMMLQQQGKTLEGFIESEGEELARMLSLVLVGLATYVPKFQIKQECIKEFVPRKYSLLKFPFSDYEKKSKGEKVDESELKNFFRKENKESKRYWIPEKRGGKQWVFDYKHYKLNVSEKEINSYYNLNKHKEFLKKAAEVEIRMILCKEKTKADKLYQELSKDSKEFAQVAKKDSEDEKTSSKGGMIGFIKKGELERSIEKAAFSIKKDGAISKVVKGENGFVIIQRVSRKNSEFVPLEKVKDKIVEQKQKNKFPRMFKAQMSALVSGYKHNKALLDKIVKMHGGKKKSVELIEDNGSDLAKCLFKTNKDSLGYYTSDNEGHLLIVDNVEKSSVEKFDDIKNKVEEDFNQFRAAEFLKKALTEAKQSGKSLEELGKELDEKIEETSWIRPDNAIEHKKMLNKGFPISTMLELEKVGAIREYYKPNSTDDGYIVRLDKAESIAPEKVSEKEEEIEPHLYKTAQSLWTDSFIASLYRNAKIKHIDSFINTKEDLPL
ncbi:hypothetical protein HN446_04965 [bacterium]|jgi:parvulin-like peptidyl-prolyl isomerase|nr:hypothetical protein [bacterium]